VNHGGKGHRGRLRQFRPYGGGLLRRQVFGKGGGQAGRIARRFALCRRSPPWRCGLCRQAALDDKIAVIIAFALTWARVSTRIFTSVGVNTPLTP